MSHCRDCLSVLTDPHGNPLSRGCPGCGHDAEIDKLRADLTVVVEAGDVMSMLFEVHWTVKDTDEAVHEAVRNWKDALSRPGVQSLKETP